ncbi:MAG: hypothetical protein AAB596_01325 [Patescibacteria group bacterium]
MNSKKAFTPLEAKRPADCRKNKCRSIKARAESNALNAPRKLLTGFTLIEFLIYIGIFAVSAGLITGILITILKINQKESASVEVTSQLNFVIQTINRLVKESSAIIVNNNGNVHNDTPGPNQPYLVLRMKDSSGGVTDRDPITIWNDGANGITIEEGMNFNTRINRLTSNRVIVDQFNFTKNSQYPGHDTVSLNVQLSYNTQNPGSQFTKSIQSAISRVSAATFDSDLIPGGPPYNWNIGQTGSPWKKIIVDNGGSASPSYTFDDNLGTGLFSPGTNVLGFVTNSNERMTINANGNIGIGIDNPTAKLHISGGDAAITTQGNGLVLKATDGANCYRLRVDNTGALSTTLITCP